MHLRIRCSIVISLSRFAVSGSINNTYNQIELHCHTKQGKSMTASHPATTGETSTIYHAPQIFNQAAIYIVALLVPIFVLPPIVAIRNDLKQRGVISTGTIMLSLVVLLVIVVALWLARHLKATAYVI